MDSASRRATVGALGYRDDISKGTTAHLSVPLSSLTTAPVARTPLADQVKAIIVGHLGVDARELTPETLFRDDLGADSLDSFELLMAFEDEFDIEIPDEDAGTMSCVQDAIAYIESHIAEGSTRQRL